ncbi:hypothetical protein CEXT_731511 [Caerostris extrusa]|uniref:Uncharacterized protein n=1 Tax=Caerostris extrusa TaxID=172846 RepID=A0AAV4SQC0_CAEEX|nr:hypothetical protein CEXT_731511 [Caerostris extrusa]
MNSYQRELTPIQRLICKTSIQFKQFFTRRKLRLLKLKSTKILTILLIQRETTTETENPEYIPRSTGASITSQQEGGRSTEESTTIQRTTQTPVADHEEISSTSSVVSTHDDGLEKDVETTSVKEQLLDNVQKTESSTNSFDLETSVSNDDQSSFFVTST